MGQPSRAIENTHLGYPRGRGDARIEEWGNRGALEDKKKKKPLTVGRLS
jgi:hypothetical protein